MNENNLNQVNQQSIEKVIKQVFNHPISFAMISPYEEVPTTLRRDFLVPN